MTRNRAARRIRGGALAWLAAVRVARADPPPPDAVPAPPAPAPPTEAAPSAEATAPAEPDAPAPSGGEPTSEVIEVTGAAPVPPGTVSLDARTARQTAGALGEPFRALALLPGVTTSIAAAGYPVIRGSLPGESRYAYDGIEIPMLYHFILGNQVIHPSFLGDLQLRAGGHGAEYGHLTGGVVAMTPPAIDQPRTELRANPVELGAYHAQPLSASTSIAAAVRAGTLTLPMMIYNMRAALYYVDQQTRLSHRLDNGDALTLTSLGAYDYLRQAPDSSGTTSDKIGFHRLDVRWTRIRPGGRLRAGIETAADVIGEVTEYEPEVGTDGMLRKSPDSREGGRAYGVRGYLDGGLALASWLTVRAGVEARHRTLVNREDAFALGPGHDPFVGLAKAVDAGGAWTAIDVELGPVRITPGVRVDGYHADLYGAKVGHVTVDPRLAIGAALPGGARVELAGGAYSAPPQASVWAGNIVIGPLPMIDGAGSAAGMSHGVQAELSLRTPLGAEFDGHFAAYYRDTRYAVDFGMLEHPFRAGGPCDFGGPGTYLYRDVTTRAMGVEAMIRRQLGRSVAGWVSYSLGKIDRDFGFLQLPSDFDQRHTLNATAQWSLGRWKLGATGHLHTGRPVVDPQFAVCTVEGSGQQYVGLTSSAGVLRRLPTNWRIDLRAERPVRLGGWDARVFFELQNATLTREVIGYDVRSDFNDPLSYHRVEESLFIPLPLFGLEVVL
jgi:hypothetical protein